MPEISFSLRSQDIRHIIKAVPHFDDAEWQYIVNVNNGEDMVFAFNPKLGRYAHVGHNSPDLIPGELECSIGQAFEWCGVQQLD